MKFLKPVLWIAGMGVLTLGLSGCGAKSNVPPPMPLSDNVPHQITVQITQSMRVGSGTSSQALRLSPCVGQAQMIVPSFSGKLTSLVLGARWVMWSVDLPENISSTPTLSGDAVYVGTLQGSLYAINHLTGAVLWHVSLPSSLYAAPSVSGHTVVVQVHDGSVIAFATQTGKQLWAYHPHQPHLLLEGDASPAILGNTVFVGLHSGVLVALSLATGHAMWSEPVAIPVGSSQVSRMVDIVANPVVDAQRGMVFAGSYQGNLVAMNSTSGKILWSIPSSLSENFIIHQGMLYLTTVSGAIEGVDENTGKVAFVQAGLEYRSISSPVFVGDVLAVSDYQGYIHFLDPENGRLLARVRPVSSPMSGPGVVAQGQVFFESVEGNLIALKPDQSADSALGAV